MNVRINSGETKNPATAGFLLKSFGWGIERTLLLIYCHRALNIL